MRSVTRQGCWDRDRRVGDDGAVRYHGGLRHPPCSGLHQGGGQGGGADGGHLGGPHLRQLVHRQLDDHRLLRLRLDPQRLALALDLQLLGRLDVQLLHGLVEDLLQGGLALDDHVLLVVVVVVLLQDDLLLGADVHLLLGVGLQDDLLGLQLQRLPLPRHPLLDVDLLVRLVVVVLLLLLPRLLLVQYHLLTLLQVQHLLQVWLRLQQLRLAVLRNLLLLSLQLDVGLLLLLLQVNLQLAVDGSSLLLLYGVWLLHHLWLSRVLLGLSSVLLLLHYMRLNENLLVLLLH